MKKLLVGGALLLVLGGCGGGQTEVTAPHPVMNFRSAEDERAYSASNLKQLALAALQFTEKNDEKLPDLSSPETFRADVMPYVLKNRGKEEIFIQPRTGEPYAPNSSLSRVALSALQNPSETVLLYEKTPSSMGTRGVVYTDGHYRLIAESEWPAIKTASGIN